MHCRAPDGCIRRKAARGSGSHRAPSCAADQCQITRLARVPLSVISLSRVPRTWLPGWIPEELNFPGRREVIPTRGHERGQGDSPMAQCGTSRRQGYSMGIRGDVSVRQHGCGLLEGMTGGDVGLLSTRRKNLRPVCWSVQCHDCRGGQGGSEHVSKTPSSDCQVQGAKDQKHPGQELLCHMLNNAADERRWAKHCCTKYRKQVPT